MLTDILQLFGLMGYIFLKLWWIFVPPILYGFYLCWRYYSWNKYVAGIEWVYLQVTVPKENVISPAFTERMFAGFYGLHRTITLADKYLRGELQDWISFELVSDGGNIRFIVRCPEYHKDMVEAQIYAQYPEAEITKIDGDYVDITPKDISTGKIKLGGTELKLKKEDAYPIRTYPEFEHSMSKTAIDPLAGVTSVLNSLGPGEHMWIQLMIMPPTKEDSWIKESEGLIKKLKGEAVERQKSLSEKTLLTPIEKAGEAIAGAIGPSEEEGKKKMTEKEWPSLMQFLSPGEKNVLEAVERNISKVGFLTKFRIVYFASPDKFVSKRLNAILGPIRQFSSLDLNSLVPDKNILVKAYYVFVNFRKKWRGKKLLRGYMFRSFGRGGKPFVLNVEELATIFHFPDFSVVQTPGIEKVEAKKAMPPTNLPME